MNNQEWNNWCCEGISVDNWGPWHYFEGEEELKSTLVLQFKELENQYVGSMVAVGLESKDLELTVERNNEKTFIIIKNLKEEDKDYLSDLERLKMGDKILDTSRVSIPSNWKIDMDNITSTLEKGIFTITLPKDKSGETVKKIKVG